VGFLFTSILRVEVRSSAPGVGKEILLYTYKAASTTYFKYTVGGMNVVLVNLLPFVAMVVGLGWGMGHDFQKKNAAMLFAFSMISMVPLSYYVGTAISRLTAQTSFAVGALLNATFGSMIEIILFITALSKGYYDLTLQALTGTFLGNFLLLPGLSFVVGGFKYKEQRFNKEAAGVSSVMVILATVGVYLPSLLYAMFRVTTYTCSNCLLNGNYSFNITGGPGSFQNGTVVSEGGCGDCHPTSGVQDARLIDRVITPIAAGMALIMPISYAVGLWFTLKTHAHIYDEDLENEMDEDKPLSEWSKPQCVIILFTSTVLFALVSEVLTNVTTGALDTIGISESFAGLTLISVVTNLTEYVNAIRFTLANNVSLSLEIGSSAAIQCAFIQVTLDDDDDDTSEIYLNIFLSKI
jgi:Ca2+:H+ antiporter